MNVLELQRHVELQVKNYLCYELDISKYITDAVKRTYVCLSHSRGKYYSELIEGEIPFSVYHSLQYCIFLYQISRTAYEIDKSGVSAEKFYYLNKIMNSVDIFYEVEFPGIWGAEHPLGSVMGRAKYSDYFFFYQGCTVGGNKGNYPQIGKYVTMYSNSKILGKAEIGHNVIVSANTYIKDEYIPNNCIVFGKTPNLIVKQKSEAEIRTIISHIWPYSS